jgi:hypothetical protein
MLIEKFLTSNKLSFKRGKIKINMWHKLSTINSLHFKNYSLNINENTYDSIQSKIKKK